MNRGFLSEKNGNTAITCAAALTLIYQIAVFSFDGYIDFFYFSRQIFGSVIILVLCALSFSSPKITAIGLTVIMLIGGIIGRLFFGTNILFGGYAGIYFFLSIMIYLSAAASLILLVIPAESKESVFFKLMSFVPTVLFLIYIVIDVINYSGYFTVWIFFHLAVSFIFFACIGFWELCFLGSDRVTFGRRAPNDYNNNFGNGINNGVMYVQPNEPPLDGSIPERIAKLSKLRDDGIITEDDFERKKKELLSQMH